MTLHTPVVLTDDEAVAAAARDRHWPVVRRQGDQLTLTGVKQTVPLPEPSMRIEGGSLAAPHHAGWKLVLDWLEKHVHRPMMVVEPNGYAEDLALWSASSRNWPVAAWVRRTPVVAAAGAVSLVASAVGVVFIDETVKAMFTSNWLSKVSELAPTPLIDVISPSSPSPRSRAPEITRVLLVAYYSGDDPTVGAQRPTYWFETLEELSKGRIEVDLATATPWEAPPGRVHVVPDLGPAALAPGRGEIESWATVATSHAAAKSYAPTRHRGGYWQLALERYFDARDDHYDVVIITGDPFEYFGFAAFAQRRWYAKTILDYRDPFALNPRRAFTEDSQAEALNWERGWNMATDVITVVHEANRDTVVPAGPDTRVEVIHNGWDDRVPAPTRCDRRKPGPLRVGHAGQFFAQTPPGQLLDAIAATGGEFHHMGRNLEDTRGADVHQYGRLPRSQVLEVLSELDCGIAWITAGGAEIPTKVFDYLVAGLDVVVLHGENHTASALHGMLAGVAGVHFVPDNTEDIGKFFEGFTPGRHDPDRAAPFSRRASSLALVDLLLELGNNLPDEPIFGHALK